MPKQLKTRLKNKLEISDYNRILSSLILSKLALISCEAKLNDEIKISDKINISIDNKNKTYRINSNSKFEVIHKYVLKGVSFNDKKKYIEISATFLISYKTTENIDEHFFSIYREQSLDIVTWPYFREFVNNITARMYIPPLIIPQIIR